MSKSLMVMGAGSLVEFLRVGAGVVTKYFACANAPLVLDSTRVNTQITYHTPGIMSDTKVSVGENELAVDTTITLQVNGIDSGLSVTIAGGTTGTFAFTGTATIADGDEVNFAASIAADDPGIAIRFMFVSAGFDATGTTMVRHAATNFAQQINANVTYMALSDNCSTLNTTLAYADFDCNAVGGFRNLFVYVSQFTNTLNFTSTIDLMVNGSAVASFTKAITGTGIFELTGLDWSTIGVIAANDNVCLRHTTTGTGSITPEIVSVEWVSAAQQFHMVFGLTGAGFAQAANTDRFIAPGGGGALAAFVESYSRVPMGFVCNVSNLTAYKSTNLITDVPPAATQDILYVRKNGVNTAVEVDITRGAGGAQVESTSTDTFSVSTDEISIYSDTGGSAGSLTYRHFGLMVKNLERIISVGGYYKSRYGAVLIG